MDSNLWQYLYREKCSVVDAAIQRVPRSGEMTHYFSLIMTKVLDAAGKQRVTENLMSDVEQFFSGFRIQADYNETARTFDLTVDLNQVRFEPEEARIFSLAINRYRMDYGD